MKEGWSYKKLGEVCEVISGQSPEGKFYNTEGQGTPFYQGKKEFSSKYIGNPTTWTTVETKIAEKDDLLMSVRAPVGDINFATQRLCIGRGLAAIRTKEDIDKEYLFYFLVAQKSCIKGKEGVGFASINRKEIMDIDVQYPKDFSEQHSIVTRLDAAFSHIDALKANAEKQLNEARKLFQAELTECMKPKEGWEEKTLGELATDMYRGSGIKREQVTKEGTPCVRYGEIYTTYNVAFDKCVSHTCEEMIPSPKYFEHGDLLFAITGESVEDIGKTIAYLGQDKCLLGGDIICMKHKQNAKYLSYALSTPDAIRQKGIGKTKLKVVHTNASALKAINVPIPPLDTQQAIVSHLDSLSSTIRKLEELQQKTIAECDALKQAMLREVFE